MKLLIGTKNKGKLDEMATFIGGPGFTLVGLEDVARNIPEIAETGVTMEENAIIKATAYWKWSRLPTVADDAGLEIDALGGEPGVMSRRWPTDAEKARGAEPREKTDAELIGMALEKLRGIPEERRTARLRMVCAYHDGKRTLTETAAIEGRIIGYPTQPVVCTPGYPFRSIFWVPQYGTTYELLTPDQHEAVNHRREAYGKLRKLILAVPHLGK
jgi:XTP/dITP diphosphohydrolase